MSLHLELMRYHPKRKLKLVLIHLGWFTVGLDQLWKPVQPHCTWFAHYRNSWVQLTQPCPPAHVMSLPLSSSHGGGKSGSWDITVFCPFMHFALGGVEATVQCMCFAEVWRWAWCGHVLLMPCSLHPWQGDFPETKAEGGLMAVCVLWGSEVVPPIGFWASPPLCLSSPFLPQQRWHWCICDHLQNWMRSWPRPKIKKKISVCNHATRLTHCMDPRAAMLSRKGWWSDVAWRARSAS